MKPLSQKSTIALIAGIGVLIVLLGCGALLAYRVYTYRDDSKIVRALAGGMPAAKAGTHLIPYGDFLKTRDTLRIYLAPPAAKQSGVAQSVTTQVEEQALDRLIRESLERDMALERKITVSKEDVQGAFNVMLADNSSTVPDVDQYLRDNYQWSEQDFQENVLRPAIMEERIAATFSTDTQEQYVLMEAFMSDRMAKPDVKKYLNFGQ